MRKLRLLPLALALLLLLCACSSRFQRDEQGLGFTDSKTDIYYAAMSSAYEASGAGEQVGEYVDKEYDRTLPFYRIPDMDAALYLTDDYGTVYCAAQALPDASAWAVDRILVCEQDAISVAKQELTSAQTVLAVRDAWFDGEALELPMEKATFVRRLKMACDEYAGIYYCIRFYQYENGEAYLYELESDRAVACPVELSSLLSSK